MVLVSVVVVVVHLDVAVAEGGHLLIHMFLCRFTVTWIQKEEGGR